MAELCNACSKHHERRLCCCRGAAELFHCPSGLTMYSCPHSLCKSRLFDGPRWERNTAAVHSHNEKVQPQPQPAQQLVPCLLRQPLLPAAQPFNFEEEWRARALEQMHHKHVCKGLTDEQYEPLWGAGLQGTMSSTHLQKRGVLEGFPSLQAELDKVLFLYFVPESPC